MAPSADVREAEHLPRLPDAGGAPRDTADLFEDTPVVAEDETLDLTADEVTGDQRRLTGDIELDDSDGDGLAADDVPYFRYDPETGGVLSDPPPATRLENGCLIVDD